MTDPHNLEAEESVIGALLMEPAALELAAEVLQPHDFYRESHGIIFRCALALHGEDITVDAITLADRLDREGLLARIGGKARLAELLAITPDASRVMYYATIVAETATRRRLIAAGQAITALAERGEGDLDTVKARCEEAITVAMASALAITGASITEGLDALVDSIREVCITGHKMSGELTHFQAIDEPMSGLWNGQLVLIAARPGQGKSTLALNIAENFTDSGRAVLFVSLEMSSYELQIRSLAREGPIDSMRLQTGLLTEEEKLRMSAAVDAVKKRYHLTILDNGDATVQTVAGAAARLKRTADLRLVVVDYLQLMTAPNVRSDNRAEQIGSISRGLKQLARRLDIPILAISQMNRAIETRAEKRPQLSDLRDSGSLEQDSDVVIFLHDESSYDVNKQADGETEVIIAKNRRGSTGSQKMLYTRRYSKFHDKSIYPRAEAAA